MSYWSEQLFFLTMHAWKHTHTHTRTHPNIVLQGLTRKKAKALWRKYLEWLFNMLFKEACHSPIGNNKGGIKFLKLQRDEETPEAKFGHLARHPCPFPSEVPPFPTVSLRIRSCIMSLFLIGSTLLCTKPPGWKWGIHWGASPESSQVWRLSAQGCWPRHSQGSSHKGILGDATRVAVRGSTGWWPAE